MPRKIPAPVSLVDPADAAAVAMAALLPVHAAPSQGRLADATALAAERVAGARHALVLLEGDDGELTPMQPVSAERRTQQRALVAALGASGARVRPDLVPALAEAIETGAPLMIEAGDLAGGMPDVEAVCFAPMESAGERVGVLAAFGHHTMQTHRLRLLAEHVASATMNLRSAQAAGEAAPAVDVTRAVFDERKIEAELQREIARAVRYQREVSICVMEATNVRLLRERFGETLTEQLMQRLGEALAGHAREIDVIGAYRDSGYTMVLAEASAAGAESAAHRLCAEVQGLTLDGPRPIPGLELHLAAGWATAPDDGVDVQSLFAAAQQRMYRQAA